ncbi:3-keto-5-aminohexanoate cleavage protein [Acidiphilium sp. AL]|uniref:3-keto-5-aminohexanoate cleavage protein n=1 Tax=Acidiphilium iwatense TaxID=768198 RepID=A0ABS9E1R5_9PROT|nr:MULTISPECIES: 3-keto-5-aminohexanoate cleavage protein [Acidiphilium]MCF3948946.1 3-keto-5-aminohexanoate cleavage protein [Acidiphilium iwatense]MCU4162284.1 3-keto-5-aminohexanoate cleavage protein [Acidiphilium sp. AL]
MKPIIITTAITGAVPKKQDNPAVPISPAEQIESTHAAYEAGSALVHIHVRDAQENPSSSPELFAAVQEGVKKHCPGMIIQFSTGGRGREASQRGASLYLKPDMASLTTGSVNFPRQIYENAPDFIETLCKEMLTYRIKPEIEVFDAAMLYNAVELVKRGLILEPLHVQFVMGVQNAIPVRRSLLEFLLSELKEISPTATWSALGMARHQLEVNRWCLELGGHTRTGLEDNVRFDKTRLAASNAELVSLVVAEAAAYGRRPATPDEARSILELAA